MITTQPKLVLKPVEFKGFSITSGGRLIGYVSFNRLRDHRGVYCIGGIRLVNGRDINLGDSSTKHRYAYFADVKRDLAYILAEEGVQL